MRGLEEQGQHVSETYDNDVESARESRARLSDTRQMHVGDRRRNADTSRKSRSPSPDPELLKFLSEQARPISPDSEAYRKQRLAAAGVSNAKSRHQKEKEDAERRKREAAEDAARVYEDFVEHMKGEEGSKRRRRSELGFVRAGGGEMYESGCRKDQTQAESPPDVVANSAKQDTTARTDQGLHQGRRGAMKDFLGELQRNQAIREERLKERVTDSQSVSRLLAQEMQRGGLRDCNDPTSANICVLNLPANVSEASLAQHFSVYGDVASVKVMWPRTEDVHFSQQGHGSMERCTRHAGATGFVNFMNRSDAQQAYLKTDGSTWSGSVLRTSWSKAVGKPQIPLCRKSDAASQQGLRDLPERVELQDAKFETLESIGPFYDDGEKYVYASTEMAPPTDDEQVAATVDRFDAMLRALTLRRERIADIMFCAMKHTQHADLIVDRLIQSLLQVATPLPRKLARMYAVSDLLHNSGAVAHGAWRYRALLSGRLDAVFCHWGDVANCFTGRIKREACKDSIRALLDVWDSWMVFEAASLTRWRAQLESGSQSKGVVQSRQAIDQNPVREDVEQKRLDEEDIDGEAMTMSSDAAEGDTPSKSPTVKVAYGTRYLEDIDGEEM